MKRTRLFLAGIILSVFCGTGIFAADLTLETVCNQLAEHPNTTGDFTQTKTILSTKREIKSSGNFIFSLDGILWNTVRPFPSSLAVGKSSVIQTAANGTKTIIDASDNQIFGSIATTLTSVFSNDVEQLKKNFSVTFSDKGSGAWELLLVPNDKTVASVLKSLVLAGKSVAGTSSIDSILMTESSANTIKYEFTNQKYPKELTADEKAYFTAK